MTTKQNGGGGRERDEAEARTAVGRRVGGGKRGKRLIRCKSGTG